MDNSIPLEDDDLVTRIQGEYREMPGLSLTARQAQRLWALDEHTTARLLARLVECRYLRRTAVGTYVRVTDAPTVRQVRRAMGERVIARGRDREPVELQTR
jgi:hypothetical protein